MYPLASKSICFFLYRGINYFSFSVKGVCAFPTISREPRVVFPSRKKFKRPEEIVNKKFILSSETFEFGPLLAGKNRERYREGRYPENMEHICISNTSPMPAQITFAYLNDSNATTFLLEPPAMSLEPGENQTLSLWAYPKTPGRYDDTLVCCVKENPEPILFKVAAEGVRPELELDKKTVLFDRVLLHRYNPSLLLAHKGHVIVTSERSFDVKQRLKEVSCDYYRSSFFYTTA